MFRFPSSGARSRRGASGFTLIEVVVVVAILGIMSVLGLTSYNESKRIKAVDTSAVELVSWLAEQRNNALTGEQPANGAIPCSYGFVPISGQPAYNLRVKTKGSSADADCATGTSNTDRRVNLKPSVSFSATPPAFEFVLPRGESNLPNGTTTILLRSGSGSSIVTGAVCIYTQGGLSTRIERRAASRTAPAC